MYKEIDEEEVVTGGLSYKEIAHILDLTIKEVRIIEYNALRKMKLNPKVYELFIDNFKSDTYDESKDGLL